MLEDGFCTAVLAEWLGVSSEFATGGSAVPDQRFTRKRRQLPSETYAPILSISFVAKEVGLWSYACLRKDVLDHGVKTYCPLVQTSRKPRLRYTSSPISVECRMPTR